MQYPVVMVYALIATITIAAIPIRIRNMTINRLIIRYLLNTLLSLIDIVFDDKIIG